MTRDSEQSPEEIEHVEDVEVGETYDIDDLPDSEMHNGGKVENISYDRWAAQYDGRMVEFELALKVVEKYDWDRENGKTNVEEL